MKFDWDSLASLSHLDCDYSGGLQSIVKQNQKTDTLVFKDDHIFANDVTNEWGQSVAILFQSWRDNPSHAPSMISILAGIIDYFDIDANNSVVPFALLSCALSDIPHRNPYHNNAHFREVVCIAIKLIIMHNETNRDPMIQLSHDDIVKLIMVTAIHDFAHDGQGNIIEGSHIPSRLEKKSIAKARPFFEALPISEKNMDMMELMILSTDVSRGNMGRSPAGYVRDIFLAHEHDNVSIVNTPKGYEMLVQSHRITLMCVLLCEADIAMSSSLDYEFSKEMTKLIAKESSVLKANPNTLHGFMEVICHGGFLSRAAQATLGQSFQAILLQAEEDKIENTLYA